MFLKENSEIVERIKELAKKNISKRKAGYIIHEEFPDIVKTPEDGRHCIRRLTGSNGGQSNRKIF